MQTIDELKQAAVAREEKQKADAALTQELSQIAAQRSTRELLAFLAAESPLGSAGQIVIDEVYSGGNKTIVTFQLDGHADIQARYTRGEGDKYDKASESWVPGPWQHEGFESDRWFDGYREFSPDDKKQWRVREFVSVAWESESEEYYARYAETYFADLGEALLFAERKYKSRAEIAEEVAQRNALAAFTSPVAEPKPAPAAEPTEAEIYLDALNRYIDARVAERTLD